MRSDEESVEDETFNSLQIQQGIWAEKNFGRARDRSYNHPMLGVVEEVGELAHALLKQEQGIRGSWEEMEEKAKDSVADIVIFLLDLCTIRGWNMQEIVETTWAEVRKRKWK